MNRGTKAHELNIEIMQSSGTNSGACNTFFIKI